MNATASSNPGVSFVHVKHTHTHGDASGTRITTAVQVQLEEILPHHLASPAGIHMQKTFVAVFGLQQLRSIATEHPRLHIQGGPN